MSSAEGQCRQPGLSTRMPAWGLGGRAANAMRERKRSCTCACHQLQQMTWNQKISTTST